MSDDVGSAVDVNSHFKSTSENVVYVVNASVITLEGRD